MNEFSEFAKRYLPLSVENTAVLFVLFQLNSGGMLYSKEIGIDSCGVCVCQYAYGKRSSSHLVPVGHTVLCIFRASWY